MPDNRAPPPAETLADPLTPREAEVLSLLSQGLTNADIASRLSVALSSVKWYARRIYAKLGVHNRRAAAARARELGLGEPLDLRSAAETGRPERADYRSHLPSPSSSFVGREQALAELNHRLNAASTGLLTLVGPAGSGKTRLALEAASELLPAFHGRVWWVDLSPLEDPALLPQVVAAALHLHAVSDEPIVETLRRQLRPAPALLVLDNCEHLLPACDELVSDLLPECPSLKILATSREALALPGETAWAVPPLLVPPSTQLPAQSLLQFDAVRLFVERAHGALAAFALTEQNSASVAEVCRRLDGLPLAIELAAARVNVLTTAQVTKRLDDALGLLTRGGRLATQRHETVRAALDWSHNLLSERQRALLARLSVFVGGFSLDAVEYVCQGAPLDQSQVLDALSDLVDTSLVVVDNPSSGTRRFRLLEIVRQYADEKLRAAGQAESFRNRHLEWFGRLSVQAGPELFGPNQGIWTARLEQERGNLRAALAWSLRSTQRNQAGIRVATGLVQFWQVRGDFAEGMAWLDRLLAVSPEAPPRVRAGLLRGKGFLAFHWSPPEEAQATVEEAVQLYREAGDLAGVGSQFHVLAFLAMARGDLPGALKIGEQGVEHNRARGDDFFASACLLAQGDAAFLNGEFGRAIEYYRESLALHQETDRAFAVARRFVRLGQTAGAQGDFAQAREQIAKGLNLARQIGDNWGVTMAVAALGTLAAAQDQPGRGAVLLGATQARLDEYGARFWPLDRIEYDRTAESLRAALGPVSFQAKSDEGRTLSSEQALAYALESQAADDRPSIQEGANLAGLTRRETEVLRLIAAGESNRAIADELVLSVRTVERHAANIYQKIGAEGPAARTAAAAFAFRHGLGPALPSPADYNPPSRTT